MQVIKLEHSGLAFSKNHQTLLFDPVEITEKLPTFSNVVGIVITHLHGDHFQPKILQSILAENPQAALILASESSDFPEAKIAHPGETLRVGDFNLEFFGSNDHAAIIPGQIPCANLGVIIDQLAVNPGDSSDFPPIHPQLLFVALSAPWCKLIESIDYIKTVHPDQVIPVHDAVLSDFGRQVNNNWLRSECDAINVQYHPLLPGESLAL